jgi:hypothetical protein
VLGGDTEAETLTWLVDASEYARVRGQTKLVGYLEALLVGMGTGYRGSKIPSK